jgi:hypothetical protein
VATQAHAKGQPAAPRELTVHAQVGTLALLLSLVPGGTSEPPAGGGDAAGLQLRGRPFPLFELAAKALAVEASSSGGGAVEGCLAAKWLQLLVFNSAKLGWEPVLDPWPCRRGSSLLFCGAGSALAVLRLPPPGSLCVPTSPRLC